MPEQNGFGIRVREPGVPAAFTVQGSWGDDVDPDELRKLLAEAYAHALQRVDRELGKAKLRTGGKARNRG